MNRLASNMLVLILTVCLNAKTKSQGQLPEILKNPSHPINANLAAMAVKKSTYTLQSVLISPNRQLAQINGQLLNIGDSLGGYKLVEIRKNSATLRSSKGTLVLKTQLPSTTTKIKLR
ncbi:MAG: hypothetical protein OIF51_19875 [Cellvibrionaceae bacterium]|nr:hypothetical protein [Cellvibrionaceae bacterium]